MSHFKISDFACKCGCGLNNVELDLLTMLERARCIANIPFIINSGCRCSKHNKKEGGKRTSSHLNGLAVDIKCDNSYDRGIILKALYEVGFTRIGISKSFIHCDVDKSKNDSTWTY